VGACQRLFPPLIIVLACLLTPLLPVIDGALNVAKGQQAEFQSVLAEIAAKHGLNQVWFRAEKKGQVLADVGLGGADPDARKEVSTMSWRAFPARERGLASGERNLTRVSAASPAPTCRPM
jgi:hypothetical protein